MLCYVLAGEILGSRTGVSHAVMSKDRLGRRRSPAVPEVWPGLTAKFALNAKTVGRRLQDTRTRVLEISSELIG